MVNNGVSFYDVITQFLFNYRITWHAVTRRTPASLTLGRELRTRFSLLFLTPIYVTFNQDK